MLHVIPLSPSTMTAISNTKRCWIRPICVLLRQEGSQRSHSHYCFPHSSHMHINTHVVYAFICIEQVQKAWSMSRRPALSMWYMHGFGHDGVRQDCQIKNDPPFLQQCYVWAILHPLLFGTALLHHSLGFWTVYQRVLRPSYRTAFKLLYNAMHVIWKLYALLYRWENKFYGGTIFYVTRLKIVCHNKIVRVQRSAISTILLSTADRYTHLCI